MFGYGNIGRQVAQIGRAFGMDILAHGREGSLARVADEASRASPPAGLLSRCDVVTLHLRLVPATRGLVSADDLACMRATALFVNASRAELVEPGALLAALQAGRPGYAAVDAYEEEPVLDGRITPARPRQRRVHAASGLRREGQLRTLFRRRI